MRLGGLLRCGLSAVLVAIAIGCGAAEPKGRVIILGFDGADPSIIEQMLAAGELPNLAKLEAQGGFQRLGSSSPPQSPTAWSSFATCKNPLNHGIFDFLRRTPSTYLPGVGFGRPTQPELAPDGALAKAPEYVNNRRGVNFWKAASDQGLRVKALVVPFAYPADDLSDECRMLCGLDVPDIRGTQNTYFALSESFSAREPVAGGMRLPLRFEGGTATVNVPGIGIPGKRGEYAEMPLKVKADRGAKTVVIEVSGNGPVTLEEGEWSRWLEWTFTLSPKYQVRAVSRIHLMEAGASIRLYMTCLQYHPRAPYIAISAPETYSGELADRYALYKTIGWAYDTKALQQDDMTEEMFLDDVQRTMAWREQLTLDELDRGAFDLLIAAWTATDRVGHMFWRYRDPKHPLYREDMSRKYGRAVEDTYIKMDSIVGNVMQRMREGDLLMVMSDHGFHSYRTQFSVNTWLIRNGYLAVKGQTDPATSFADQKYLFAYDWTKTKAYGLGLGMVFINRRGREGQGIVPPSEAPALIAELKEKLLAVTDPGTGDKVFTAIYTYVNPPGAAAADAPDIQLGYAEGYQTAKASAAGAAPDFLFAPNENKWSGEHASSDVATTSGVLFSNRRLAEGPTLLDLGVTALHYLGAQVPGDFEGKSLLVEKGTRVAVGWIRGS